MDRGKKSSATRIRNRWGHPRTPFGVVAEQGNQPREAWRKFEKGRRMAPSQRRPKAKHHEGIAKPYNYTITPMIVAAAGLGSEFSVMKNCRAKLPSGTRPLHKQRQQIDEPSPVDRP